MRARGGTRSWRSGVSEAASAAGARSVRTGFPPPVSGVPHPSPGACPAASGCHRLPRVPAAGAPVPAPHPDSGGGPFLPGQAAPSVFACGGPGRETEALQSVGPRDSAFRAQASLIAPGVPGRPCPKGKLSPPGWTRAQKQTGAGFELSAKAAWTRSMQMGADPGFQPRGSPGLGARAAGPPGVWARSVCKGPGTRVGSSGASGPGSPSGVESDPV